MSIVRTVDSEAAPTVLATPHPNPPPQGGRGPNRTLPPCGGGQGGGWPRPSLVALLVFVATAAPALAQRDLKTIPDRPRDRAEVVPGRRRLRGQPVRRRPAARQADPDELRPGRPALGRQLSEVYPQIKPGQKANDKILVLEDTDGDGKADKTTVFADGLLIPTGVEPGDGGAYVANSTELLHLTDTDGDGKADRRRVVLSGFGTEDTHHILHTLRWGPDGHALLQPVDLHPQPHRDAARRAAAGRRRHLAVPARDDASSTSSSAGWCNPWGHHFDRWGQSFATDGAGGEGINYVLPGAYYATAPDAVRILPRPQPRQPEVLRPGDRQRPAPARDWQGNLLTNDFRGNRVCRFVVSDDGAGLRRRASSPS